MVKHIAALVEEATPFLGRPQLFVEPFAGGAATSLRLVGNGFVDRVLIADADPLVAQFWRTAAADPSWLVDRMWDEPVTLDRWDYWRQYKSQGSDDSELAVKCLFLNRTTFSGILHGRAGPIGGRSQSGPYEISCRFNKAGLQKRIEYVGALYETHRLVDVWCTDWETTLKDVAEWYSHLMPDRVLAYLDPPYWEKSEKLYAVSFHPAGGYSAQKRGVDLAGWRKGREHIRLAEYLRKRVQYRWILSYDESPAMWSKGLYGHGRMTPTDDDKVLLGIKEWRISKRLIERQYTVAGSGRRDPINEVLLTTLPPSVVKVGLRIKRP